MKREQKKKKKKIMEIIYGYHVGLPLNKKIQNFEVNFNHLHNF